MEHLETDPVPLGTSHIPSHIPPRRCGGLSFKRPCASRRDTPHERARARDEHHSPAMPTAHAFYARDGARDRGRAGFRVSGRCRRRVVGRVFGSSTEEPNGGRHRGGKLKRSSVLGVFFLCSVRDLPWADPPLPGTKRPKAKGVRATTGRGAGHFFLICVSCRRPRFSCLITWPFAVAKATQVCTRNRTSPVAVEESPSSRDPTTRPLRRSPRYP